MYHWRSLVQDLVSVSPIFFVFFYPRVTCTTDGTKLWWSPSTKQRRNPCFRPPPVYQDLSTRHDWLVKNAIVDLPIRMKGNSKRASDNSLSPFGASSERFGAQNKTDVTIRGWFTPATQTKLRVVHHLFSSGRVSRTKYASALKSPRARRGVGSVSSLECLDAPVGSTAGASRHPRLETEPRRDVVRREEHNII